MSDTEIKDKDIPVEETSADKDTDNKADNKKEKKKPGLLRRILRTVLAVIVILLLVAGAGIGWLSVREYKPDDVTKIEPEGTSDRTLKRYDSFSVVSWNIGYGALGDNADFFMDGGESVMTADDERLESNLSGIEQEIARLDPDVLFLQEIDEDSRRSHYVNEAERMQDRFPGYTTAFSYNYHCDFVPFPMPPIGKVRSGIMTFSEFPFSECTRYQLPCPFKWPVRVANLKRSLLVTRIPVENSKKELVLINLHLEAYDSGEGKIAQTKMLAEMLDEEYQKGNYVIAGGDFNQRFSSASSKKFPLQEGMWHPGVIKITGINGVWNYLMDESTPSCRSLDKAYAGNDHTNFQYYLIDGFITSGNMDIEKFETEDLDFVYSDHNPVYLKVRLR